MYQKKQRYWDKNQTQSLRILIVDDDRDCREIVTYFVSSMGHEVVVASNGIEAMQRVRDSCPDMVLLDLTMPQMDGFEFCHLVQADESLRDLYILVISANDLPKDKERIMELGAADYLIKPCGLRNLKARIQEGRRAIQYRKMPNGQQLQSGHFLWKDQSASLS
jgi:DNA-binding response OmpR family regulator